MYGTEKRFQKMFELSQNNFNTILEASLDDVLSRNDAIESRHATLSSCAIKRRRDRNIVI